MTRSPKGSAALGKIDEIKERISTFDLVAGLTIKPPTVPDAQGRSLALCIFHEDSHPSLRLHDGGGFNCFTCGSKGGDVVDAYALLHQLDLTAAVREMHRVYVSDQASKPT